MFAIPGLPWLKLIAAIVLLGLGFVAGHSAGQASGYKLGYAAGVKIEDTKYAAAIDQQQADAKRQFDDAVTRNNQLKDDYAKLKAQWQVDHDANEVASQALNRRIASLTRDNGRLRDPHAVSITAAGSCSDGTSAARTTDPGVSTDVPAAAGELLSDDLSRLLLGLTAEADRVLTVANECTAAMTAR